MFYFAYGSNMSWPRLKARVPSAQPCGVAALRGHRLRFHKLGRDGSGKCDAQHTGDPADCVLGVLYQISASDKSYLDRVEGMGFGYAEQTVRLQAANRPPVEAFTYLALRIADGLRPFHWYKQHVLYGAREHGLPASYIKRLTVIESVPDSDMARQASELAIYGAE